MSLRKTNRLTGSAAKIEQLGAAYLGASGRNDIYDIRRIERENTLNTLIANHTANSKHFVDAVSLTGNDHAREQLDTGLGTFHNTAMYINIVAHFKVRHFFF